MYLIYKHTNKINGKSYIGQTIGTIEWRARKTGYGYRKSPKFYNAIQITEAANSTGISASHIWSCCKNERKTAGGFFWCFELDYNDYIIQEPAIWPEANNVQQINKITNKVIAEFNSVHEASKATGINRGNISSCCRGELKTAGGYLWQFKHKTEIFDNINENLWQILDYINN